ncbi:MAG: long-chain fatty acid--CoA ligase [Candidatus Thorarchaeota archaeon]
MTYQSEDWAWIGQWSKRRAELTPNKEAIFDHAMGKRYTYDDMDDRANRLSRMLHDFGVRKGDRIAAYSKNRIEMIDLFLATGKIGAIMVPFNVRLAAPETEYLLKRTSPKILFLDPDLVEGFRPSENTLSECRIILMNQDLGDSMKETSADPIEREKLDFNDPHLIVFTGGTTGLPKGAILSHRLIFWNSVNTITSWELRSDDTQPLLFPLFHTGGWNVLLVPFYHLGARTILMGDFNPSETLQVIDREMCSIVIGVPTMFQMMAQAKEFATSSFDTVRIFISGGAPCPVAIMENYWKKGRHFKMGYGLTEVGPNNFYLPESDIKRKPSSVGFPVFHCDTKVVDDDNNPVPFGSAGELLLRGPHIFNGYWDEPEETAKTIEPDGWVHTGDLVIIDEEGFYYIVGRKKDMYISGGENVFPTEIEEVLYMHPAILEAAVIGIPDEKWGEVGKAFVSLKENSSMELDEIREYLEGKLARYKIPKYYEIRKTLPKSAAGKILKRELEKEERA